jgi:hypothetical protein
MSIRAGPTVEIDLFIPSKSSDIQSPFDPVHCLKLQAAACGFCSSSIRLTELGVENRALWSENMDSICLFINALDFSSADCYS